MQISLRHNQIAGFPLLHLIPAYLDKVISKDFLFCFLDKKLFQVPEGKSYCRLQQTCRGIAEAVRNSRHISFHLTSKDCYVIRFDKEELTWESLCSKKGNALDAEGFYGIRANVISIDFGKFYFAEVLITYFFSFLEDPKQFGILYKKKDKSWSLLQILCSDKGMF